MSNRENAAVPVGAGAPVAREGLPGAHILSAKRVSDGQRHESPMPSIDVELHARAKELFLATCEQSPAQRRSFVLEKSAGDEALRREVQSLLDLYDETQESQADDRPPEIEGYRLLLKVGEGGMGEVWKAEQLRPLRRRVAVKVLKWALGTAEVEARFDSERQTLARMDHPNIASVFDAGSSAERRPFFAMELVEGLPITEFCDALRLDLQGRLKLFVQVCRAVQHAHDRGVLHRDLKPSNLLVTVVDGKPLAKVIDFGIAKAIGVPTGGRAEFTRPGSWVGTPEYMSPEQAATAGSGAAGPNVDGRSDVYSLGVVLYELLVGVLPYTFSGGVGVDEVRQRVLVEAATRPSARGRALGAALEETASLRSLDGRRLVRSLRGDLDWMVLRALEKDRRSRYGSPGELAADVERYLDGEAVVATPPRPLERSRRYLRRHRRGVVAAVLTVVALGAGAATTALWIRGVPTVESAPQLQQRSVAVLPFSNLGEDPAADYLSDGLAEQLLDALARIGGLRVAARTSSFAFRGTGRDASAIGQELGVGAMLDGSVAETADGLVVRARLVDTRSGLRLWSHTYERSVGDVLFIQDEIVPAVVDALGVRWSVGATADMSGTRPDRATYDLYLRGRHLLNESGPEALARGVALFERAVALDPTFAPAYTGLADGYMLLSRYGDVPMEQARDEARSALERALQLDNQLPDTYASLGAFWLDRRDLESAESALRRALELNESHAPAHLLLGHVLVDTQRLAEADAAYGRALLLDPLNPKSHDAVAIRYMRRGRYDAAMAVYQRKLRIDPGSAETYRLMALAARVYGKLDDAVLWAMQATELGPDGPINAAELAMAYAALADTERALEWIDRAYELGASNLWIPAVRSGVYLGSGRHREHAAFVRQLWRTRPPPQTGPLTQEARVLLALAGRSALVAGDYAGAAEHLERAVGEPATPLLEEPFDIATFVALATAYQELGRTEHAGRVIDFTLDITGRMQDWMTPRLVVPGSIAALQLLAGDRRAALQTLHQAEADGWRDFGSLLHVPPWQRLRDDEEFLALIERLTADVDRMRRAVEATPEQGTG